MTDLKENSFSWYDMAYGSIVHYLSLCVLSLYQVFAMKIIGSGKGDTAQFNFIFYSGNCS